MILPGDVEGGNGTDLDNSILICFRSGASRGLTAGNATKTFSSSGFGGVGKRLRVGVGRRSRRPDVDFLYVKNFLNKKS